MLSTEENKPNCPALLLGEDLATVSKPEDNTSYSRLPPAPAVSTEPGFLCQSVSCKDAQHEAATEKDVQEVCGPFPKPTASKSEPGSDWSF